MRKKSSTAGQDLRTPILGGIKPPTDDSKGFAQKKLNQSSAEVGPMPKLGAIGDLMDPIKTDPLVSWLKHAKQIEPKPETSPEAEELGTQSNTEVSSWVKDHFDAKKGARKKFEQKDHAYSPGVVDRILGV